MSAQFHLSSEDFCDWLEVRILVSGWLHTEINHINMLLATKKNNFKIISFQLTETDWSICMSVLPKHFLIITHRLCQTILWRNLYKKVGLPLSIMEKSWSCIFFNEHSDMLLVENFSLHATTNAAGAEAFCLGHCWLTGSRSICRLWLIRGSSLSGANGNYWMFEYAAGYLRQSSLCLNSLLFTHLEYSTSVYNQMHV